MFTKFTPEINKVYFINQYTLFQIFSGSGGIQVDFKNYFDWQNKAIYLEKGQYIKFLSNDFSVLKMEFPNEMIFKNKEVRVLFKHLISLGYINFDTSHYFQKVIDQITSNQQIDNIIDISTKQWYYQNPFQANKEEYQIIFDTKDVIDEQYSSNISNREIIACIGEKGYNIQSLIKRKIGVSVNSLLSNKKLLESKKEIAFTDKSIKEISYDMGYNDPAYFNRVFKNNVGKNPIQFRKDFDYKNRDLFSQNIIELLQQYHTKERTLEFYASKMNLTPKALSKKVKDKMQTSLGKLIRYQMIDTSKLMLSQNLSIKDISLEMGFEEPNHFSNFFRHYTGESPSQFKTSIVS
ncbi:helix-turn-helix domain-containing protein [Aquimarina sp. 2201CG14-23]|uniref:helix-turn-helix domain-containing protein n=1 Tax=Aquimarina mycalae TaxID=3040073 RepID=UPI0024781446|nr:AraC family transcriptional regulator [Aquimarina sp. 2201CG14-23]MDH7448136.1 AraC family transcriptional regulator [Aquimarina sp. 2201CG14-23]